MEIQAQCLKGKIDKNSLLAPRKRWSLRWNVTKGLKVLRNHWYERENCREALLRVLANVTHISMSNNSLKYSSQMNTMTAHQNLINQLPLINKYEWESMRV